MRHDYRVEGEGFVLRPVTLADAPLIVTLRNDPTRAQFLHPISPAVSEQVSYLERYFSRPDDYYFVVERCANGAAEGLIGLYDVDREAGSGEWGRWVLRHGSVAAVESALLIYRFAFEVLRLRMVYCRTVAENAATLSFHDSCGLERVGGTSVLVKLGERQAELVEHRLTSSHWPSVEALMLPLARRIAARVNRAGSISGS